MRLTKIYTKVGDAGQTMLATGVRVSKTDLRIETYGTVDELNSFLGYFRDTLRETDLDLFADLDESLQSIQNEMHDLGAELSMPPEALEKSKQKLVCHTSISRLENEIDHFNESLKPLENFVLPGGHRANSTAHICRTICRRLERTLVRLATESSIRKDPCIYVNRLSDWLFVVSRTVSHRLDVPEVLWQQ